MTRNGLDRNKLVLAAVVCGVLVGLGPMAAFGFPGGAACLVLGLLNIPVAAAMVLWAGLHAVRVNPTQSSPSKGWSNELDIGHPVARRGAAARRSSLIGHRSAH